MGNKRSLLAFTAMIGACTALSGCLTRSINTRPPVVSDGMGSDLRVMLDDTCLPQDTRGPGDRTLGFGQELALQAGMLAFDSVGAWLQQMVVLEVRGFICTRMERFYKTRLGPT